MNQSLRLDASENVECRFLVLKGSYEKAIQLTFVLSAIGLGIFLFGFRLHAEGTPLPASQSAVLGGCPSIMFGQVITNTIELAGETDCFGFNGVISDTIRIRVAETSGNLNAHLDLVNLADNKSNCSTIVGETTCVLKASGDYKVVVSDFGGTGTGTYHLFLQRMNDPIGCTPLVFGALPATGKIESAAEIDCFTITGAALDQIRIRVVETSSTDFTAHFEVTRSDGSFLCSTVVGEKDCQLDETGQHTILIKDFAGTKLGTYALYVQRLNQPLGCSTIDFGTVPTAAQIDVPVEMDCFTFAGVISDTVRVRAIETSGSNFSLFFELFRPDGTSLCKTNQPEESCILDVQGQHLLLFKDFAGTKTGGYSVLIQRLNQPVNCTSFGFNGLQTATLQVAAQVDCYTFQSTGSGSVTLNVQEKTEKLSAFSEIIRPSGASLCETILDDLNCDLDTPGQHTILIKDFSGTITGTYQLRLFCASGSCGAVVTPTPTHTPLPSTATPTPTQTPVPPTATPSPTPVGVGKHEQFLPLVTR